MTDVTGADIGGAVHAGLESSDVALAERHDLVMLDLDGVVYVGGEAVAGAAEALAAVRELGTAVAFITNNASRRPATVAAHLRELGVDAVESDVVTSSQAAAQVLLEQHGPRARIAVLGTDGLRWAVEDAGLVAVAPEADAVAVVTGYGPDVVWQDVMRVAVRVREGLAWVASNTDMSFPAAFGTAPGHGVMVEMLRRFTGVEPVVAGKPERPLLDETVRRVGGELPLMVGDRLDTDIEGAVRSGMPSLLVRTGVTGLRELVEAERHERPTYLARGLEGLLVPHPPVEVVGSTYTCGGWSAEVLDATLTLRGGGAPDDWWRAAVSAAWSHRDTTGEAPGLGDLQPPDDAR